MLIALVNVKGGSGKSTVGVNLACQLAGLDHLSTDRWRGKHSVVLVDADAKGTAAKYCSGGHLPVSSERLPIEDGKDIERWIQRILAIEVDFVVVDAPPHVDIVTKAIIGISDLVVVPCSADGVGLVAAAPMVELIRLVRSARSDGGPKCLFIPTRVNVRTAGAREIETALRKLGETVGPPIHQRDAFVDAAAAGRWIGDFAFNSAAHRDIKKLASVVLRLGKTMNGGKTNTVLSIQATKKTADATATHDAVEYSVSAGGRSPETD
jgi:chromosome partitioning protein